MSFSESYARWVLDPANSFKTGKFIKDSARRFLSDLERTDIYFDEQQGNDCITFIEENLYHWEDKWAGTKVILEPWQKFIYQQIYGWIIKDTGLRRVRTVFIEIAKKNAKTSMCAFLALYHLFADRINAPKIFVGANNHDQANICVNCAGKIIESSPDLAEYLEDGSVQLSKYNGDIHKVTHNERNGFIKTMPKEPATNESKQAGGKHGINPSLVVIDEYAMADSDSLLNTMENAQGAREEPLLACITTAGHKKQGPCFQKLRDTGIRVTEGSLKDDSFLAFIYEIDKPIDSDGLAKDIDIGYLIGHPEIWQQSNPNYKVSVFDTFLRTQLTKAANEGGSKMVDVQTFNFNVWVDSPEVFISAETWNKNAHGFDQKDLYGRTCYGGIKLVGGKGLSAFALLFPGDIVKIKMIYWMPKEYINNNPEGYDGYGAWQHLIHIDAGNTVENSWISQILVEEISKYQMHSFAFPKGKDNDDIVQALIKESLVGNPISQAVGGMGTPTSQWEDILTANEVEHFNDPVLSWMNGNCNVIRKEAGIRVEEKGSKTVGISACINALAQWKSIAATEGNDQMIESW
jgi:phage terminase large subunit-like protein